MVITLAHGSESASPISWGNLSCDESEDRREAIFEDDEAWERLLQTLSQACQETGWQVHAAASFAFLRHARSANLRASFAPRRRQSELMSQSNFGQ